MKKRVILYTNPDDPNCRKVEKFLLEQDIILKVNDINAHPLDFNQISDLLKNYDLKHFYNSNGHSKGKKNKTTESETLDRRSIMEKMAEDNKLLRLPITQSGRLMTVGDNTERLTIMLQVTPGGTRDTYRK